MWSKERIWEWYTARPWIRGCNYMSADCANRFDQWQAYGFEERLETTRREFALMAETGLNAIRIIPEFYVWEQEHDGFMERFDRYLSLAAEYGISAMVVLGNDCCPPYEEAMRRLHLGEQTVDWGYHGGYKMSQHGGFAGPGYSVLDDPEKAEKYYQFVRELVTVYQNDERVLIWDVFNEPGNSNRGSLSLPHMKRFFEIIHEIDPIQPTTVGIMGVTGGMALEIEQYGLENSDIISFHNYASTTVLVKMIRRYRAYGRPMLLTEWLNRSEGNTVQAVFPLLYLEKIGSYNWGLVAGKAQYFEAWNSVWEAYDRDPKTEKMRNFDFTKWLHDLYRPNHRPYDPHEIELMKAFCAMADEDFKQGGK